ncbi:ABC transporter substrate-binding protein [Thalassotalea ponticola]|uniref:ABC transporter substrate-binding protein n=1 Tax=Thalassotalea ponticola TaxID=1523392 RepID=UPI0025B585FB|nr:ABC transporter substrate-binding protein [Thalassotalea ponticola]MDN3653169.1 ABC transporter substrate-binding protein [Thalassotalea ponticola]
MLWLCNSNGFIACCQSFFKPALFALLFAFIAGCSDVEQAPVLNEGIIYCSEGAPNAFNPQLVTSGTTIDATSRQLYNRLLDFNAQNYDKVPSLAKSWHVTKDGRYITFYLRHDVSFHQTEYFTPTRTLNADDVIFSFNRILDVNNPFYKSAKGQFPFFQSIDFDALVDTIERIDDYTIRFHLNYPQSSFLANLAAPFSVILSKEYADYLVANQLPLTRLDSMPIGTGPFKFKSYQVGSLIRYARHENYWRKNVQIKQLLFNISPRNTGRLTKLFTHECDVISYPIALQEIRSRTDLELEQVTSFNVAYMAFNTQKPPFDNPVVRRAIAHAINKQAIISAVYFDQADIADSLLPKASWAYDSTINGIEYSVSKAKRLLRDAGLENGFQIDLWAMPVQRAYNPNALKMAKLIQADLAQIGVTVNIVRYEWSTFLKKLARGEHQSVLIGWLADHPDPDNFFSPLLSCAAVETGSNRAQWCNRKFDRLLKKSLLTNDLSERQALYTQAQQMLIQEIPLLPIAHAKRSQARLSHINGNILTAIGGISFEDVHKQVEKQ